MRIKALQFKKEDRTEVAIYVYFYEDISGREWRIDDIRYREFRKRNWNSLYNSFESNYDYRKLPIDDRKKYKLKRYVEFVGEDKLKEAIMQAWQALKPNIDEVLLNA